MKTAIAVAAILIALPAVAEEQKSIASKETVTEKAQIVSIDNEERSVTVKNKHGYFETLYAGPEVKRFNELKVGDNLTFRYTESTVYQIRKPGDPVTPDSSPEATIERGTGPKPSATATGRETKTVLVKAVDPKASSVTVEGPEHRIMSLKVENKDLLKNVQPGDRVEISFTTALMISVE